MSIEPTIDQMNEVIALFDGCEMHKKYGVTFFRKDGENYFSSEMKYHSSWDWLMSVVDKIEALENKRFGVCIEVLDTMIIDYKVGYNEREKIIIQTYIYPDNGDTKISITHDAVYQFIQWYNKQQSLNIKNENR